MADTKTLREAADAALAVLVKASSFMSRKARDRAPKVIADLRAALAAQAQAEPVACRGLLMRSALALEVVSDDWRESDPTLRVDLARATTANNDALAAQAQPVADELRIARGAIRELEAKVFSQEQALAVLRASVDSYHRDMADPPGYLQDAVIRAAGLGAMAEQIAALKAAQPVRQPLTQAQVDAIVNASREAGEGPSTLVRRVERAVLDAATPKGGA